MAASSSESLALTETLKGGREAPDKWDEKNGAVTSEFRGSSLLERYLDPNESATNMGRGVGGGDFWHGWDRYYRFRIVRRERFAP